MFVRQVFQLTLALTVTGALSALWFVRPVWMEEAGLDWWNLDTYQQELIHQTQRSENLDWQDQSVKARIARKEELLTQLLSRKWTLLETAPWFHYIDQESSEFSSRGSIDFLGCTEEERYCRQVLQWVSVETREALPGSVELVRCLLEAELDEHLEAHDGYVLLPRLWRQSADDVQVGA